MSNKEEEVKKILRESGLKITPTRILLLKEFKKVRTPLNAETLLRKIGSKKIDLATIYRNLETFLAKKIIRKVDLRNNFLSYELSTDHHHHIVCQKCGFIEDFKLSKENCKINNLSKEVLNSASHFKKTLEHSFELFGICIKCQK